MMKAIIHVTWKHIGWIALVLVGLLYNDMTRADGLYLDLGLTYVGELKVTERAQVAFGDYTISAEASATLDVDTSLPMIRIGYIFHGFGLEYDTIGIPSIQLTRINLFYRFEF